MRPLRINPGTVCPVATEKNLNVPSDRSDPPRYSRRSFLGRSLSVSSGAWATSTLARLATPAVGASAIGGASALLAACSNGPVAPIVVPLFSPDHVLATGRLERIPFAIVTPDPSLDQGDVALPDDDGEVLVTVKKDGETVLETAVAGRIVDHDHVGEPDPDHQHANLFRYYALRAELDEPGIYDLTIAIENTETEMVVQLFDPSEVSVPLIGEPFPAVATPTFDDSSAVDRLCTRIEPCPFHTVSADQVMAEGRPMALLVATPAFCSTAYCGPVLETLIGQQAAFDGVEFLHVEVYENTDEVDGNYADPRIRLAPAIIELGLEFEPSLFLVSADGILVDRIDNVFDSTELSAALRVLTA